MIVTGLTDSRCDNCPSSGFAYAQDFFLQITSRVSLQQLRLFAIMYLVIYICHGHLWFLFLLPVRYKLID